MLSARDEAAVPSAYGARLREKPEKLVTVRAVGVKDRSRLSIGGEEIDLS